MTSRAMLEGRVATIAPHSSHHEDTQGADPIDLAVASTLRSLRKARGVTQQALAEHLGVTFQQVQKYESAANRMAASTLYKVAAFFGVCVGDLFARADVKGEPGDVVWIATCLGGARFGVSEDELTAVLSLYQRVENPEHRRAIRDLMMRLAGVAGGGADRRTQAQGAANE